MDDSSIRAIGGDNTGNSGGSIEVTAEQVALSNHSTIATSNADFFGSASPGPITLNVGTFSATDSTILAKGASGNGGAVTIQGLQGSGSFAHSIAFTNTEEQTLEFA